MKHTLLISIVLFLISGNLTAQSENYAYWVFFKDKTTSFQPEAYFSAYALNKLQEKNLPADDICYYPLNPDYVKTVSALSTSFLGQSRWFNAIFIKTTPCNIAVIQNLPFVGRVEERPAAKMQLCRQHPELSAEKEFLFRKQTAVFHPEVFHNKNIDASGVRVAILDGGFPGTDTHPAFEHLRKSERIIKTKDFSRDKGKNVFFGSVHGTMVLSCIAGMYEDKAMGLATGSEFLLAKTEVTSEPYVEEVNWLEAMEWAHKNGADIINSSLGYTHHRYFTENMDGKTSLVSRAASMAAAKGILVVNAAGNEGGGKWEVIGTPADADSILSVGGVSPDDCLHINFSSYGPTQDGRLKPNVSALGKAMVADKHDYTQAYGTSFASPLTAGYAACVKQAFPELSVMELLHKIEASGSLYPYYDYAHGYGIPDARKLWQTNTDEDADFEFIKEDELVKVHLSDACFNEINIHDRRFIFYNIQYPSGLLEEYKVIQVFTQDPIEVPLDEWNGFTLNVYFNGHTKSFEL